MCYTLLSIDGETGSYTRYVRENDDLREKPPFPLRPPNSFYALLNSRLTADSDGLSV